MTEPERNAAQETASGNRPEGTAGDSLTGPNGVVIEQYVLLEKLSASRTGLIFKARHRLMDRIVAVKFLSDAAAASKIFTARFHRAIQILARLEHRNLVKAFEAGEQRGTHYLIMKYVDGQDLRTIVKENGPLGVEEAVRYTIQAAASLAAAHQQGVCHRNIKPGNLLVDRAGVIKIVGFTLAHVGAGGAASEAGVEDNLTRQGQAIGTYEFMSPEQARDSSSIDRRADIYSLGCTLYMLLTGRPPYVTKPGMAQVLAHCGQPVPSLCQARREVHEALDRVFQKMMAKNPDDRYGSMEEVMADLEASLTVPAPAAKAVADHPRPAAGPAASPARPADSNEGPRPSKKLTIEPGPRLALIVAGGVLGLLALVFAVKYFSGQKSAEIATSDAPPATVAGPAAAPPAPAKKEHPEPRPKRTGKPDLSPLPVPDEAARRQASERVRDMFQGEIDNARTSAEKSAVAKNILRQAGDLDDDPAVRYVMLETCGALAKEAADATTAMGAVNMTARYYSVDAWSAKANMLADLSKVARQSLQHWTVAQQALGLAQKAVEAGQFDTAARLGELAVAEAGKTDDPRTSARIRSTVKEVEQAVALRREYDAAKMKLTGNPHDPEANLVAGRYECLIADKWNEGLRKLAAGSKATLRALAAKDLAQPKDAEHQAGVGDGWWELAEAESGATQTHAYRRVAVWYEKASSKATGPLKAKVRERLETIRAGAAP